MRMVQAGSDFEGVIGLILFVGWIIAQITGAVRRHRPGTPDAAAGPEVPPSPPRFPEADDSASNAETELSKFLSELRRASEAAQGISRAESPAPPEAAFRPVAARPAAGVRTQGIKPPRRLRTPPPWHRSSEHPPLPPIPVMPCIGAPVSHSPAPGDVAPPAVAVITASSFSTGAHGSQGLSMPTLRMPTLRQPGLRAGLAFQMPVMHSRSSWVSTMKDLRHPRGIRAAMVGREILGPPRAYTPPPGA